MTEHWRRKGAELYGTRKEFIRWQLPYGCFHCPDGREVLFDRDYCPICQRYPESAPTMADPTEWIPYARQEWFYSDRHSEKEKLAIATAKLEEWGMLEPVMKEIDRLIQSRQRKLVVRAGRRP
jgi:hypothetical protein